MMTSYALIISLLGAFTGSDTFDYPNAATASPQWLPDSMAWEVQDATLRVEGGSRSAAVWNATPWAAEMVFEADITVQARQGDSWLTAGIGFRQDENHYWHLAFAEGPESTGHAHLVELTEMYNGNWLAQTLEPTRLAQIAGEGQDFNWQYNQTYHFRLTLTRDKVEGIVTHPADGAVVARIAWALNEKTVRTGKPMLIAGDAAAVFDNAAVTVSQEAPPPAAPPSYPAYTGHSSGIPLAQPAGFFRVVEKDGRAWLADPAGDAFYIVGTDHARYDGHWCEKLGYAPYARVAQNKYGTEENWAVATSDRLKAWGFNTLTAGNSRSLRYRGLAHIEFTSFGSAFASIDDLCPKTTWTGFPNVFSPKWARHCDIMARKSCEPLKNDAALIGYFLDNELEWFGKNYRPWGLFDEAWKKPADHSAKQAWIAFLKQEVPDIATFETLWGIKPSSWEELAANTEPLAPRTQEAEAITERWVRKVAEEYFRVVTEAVRRYDPNHLILGSRFAGSAPNVWDICGKHCDIVSFNIYPRIDVDRGIPQSVITQIMEWHDACQKPMMVTEWSFPALDTDRPSRHGAGMRVDNQEQRTRCFSFFQTAMFSLPFMIGSDYFMYLDEPALGIASTFPEDSNYGLVSEQDEPYPAITNAAATLNPKVYDLHANAQVAIAPSRTLPDWIRQCPETQTPIPSSPVTITTGALTLTHPSDGNAWTLSLNGTMLATLAPMLHQVAGHDYWLRPTESNITAYRETDRCHLFDIEFAFPGAADGAQPFRTACRYRISKDDSAWLQVEFLWAENTGPTSWQLDTAYQYLIPAIGGDPANDEPIGTGVPNYYIDGGAWADPVTSFGTGCWYLDTETFSCNYWKDPNGGFHPDLSQAVKATLQPGERINITPAPAFFFGFQGATLADFGKAVQQLTSSLLTE